MRWRLPWLRGSADDAEIDRELKDHLELEAEAQRARGLSPEEARFTARRLFGNVGQVKENVRGVGRWAFVEILQQDLRYAWRTLRRSPPFTVATVVSLGLGIGANTAVFSLINALLLRPLPVPAPNELVHITATSNGEDQPFFSYPAVPILAEQASAFGGACGFSQATLKVARGEFTASTAVEFMTGGCFPVLRLSAARGRLLQPSDDNAAGGSEGVVAVVSFDYWQRVLAGSSSVIGTRLVVDGTPVTIVGVAPAGYEGLHVGRIAHVILPASASIRIGAYVPGRLDANMRWLRMLGRLGPGISVESAELRTQDAWPRMAGGMYGPRQEETMRQARVVLLPGATGWSDLRAQFTRPLVVLMVSTGILLLVACANVANLLLARGVARRREVALRLALGVSRLRLMGQFATESLLLSAMGAVAAIALAYISSRLLVDLLSLGRVRPIALDVHPDMRVLGFTMIVSCASMLLFAIGPALRATSLASGTALREESRTTTRRRRPLSAALVSFQIALSLLLLSGAGLFLRTLHNLRGVDAGFSHRNVLLVSLDLPRRTAEVKAPDEAALATRLVTAAAALPSVRAAAITGGFIPLSGGRWTLPIVVVGESRAGVDSLAEITTASPGLFEVRSTPLLLGRAFTWDDVRGPKVVVVNETFARQRFAGASPIGRRIRLARVPGYDDAEIVGVAKDVSATSLRTAPAPGVYVHFFQMPNAQLGGGGILEVLAKDDGGQATEALQRLIRDEIPGAGITVRRFSDVVSRALINETVMALLATSFAAVSLVLASVGLYGLLAFSVAGRRPELAIRNALGASRGSLIGLVLTDAFQLTAVGAVIGVVAVLGVTRLVASMLFGVAPADARTIGAALVSVVATAAVASAIPAWRATRVNPAATLRHE